MNKEITFGSLFAGIGGIDLGFERAGFTCKWQVEIDDYANKVLEKHWPNVHRERDINECRKENLESVDVIAGGFPCQDLSYAGRGAGLDGERSGLFFEAIRLVCELRPRIIMLENVAALLTRGLDRVCGTMAAVGYDAEWHCIPAAAVGAPHIRDRIFIIGINTDRESQLPEVVDHIERNEDGYFCTKCQCGIFEGCECNLGEWECRECGEFTYPFFYEFNEGCQYCSSQNVRYAFGNRSTTGMARQDKRKKRNSKIVIDTSDGRGGERIQKDVEWWAVEPDVGRVAHGVPHRVDRLKGLGNAVVPQVAEFIARQIMENYFNAKEANSDASL